MVMQEEQLVVSVKRRARSRAKGHASVVPSTRHGWMGRFNGALDQTFDGRKVASESDPRLFVNAVEKSLRTLYSFVHAKAPLNIAQVGELSGLGRSGAQRTVYTLERLGFLKKDLATRRFSLTLRVLDFAAAYVQMDALVPLLIDHFSEINYATGESISLAELDDAEIVSAYRLTGKNKAGANYFLGMRTPAFCSAAGRSILAFLDEAEASDILDRIERPQFTRFTKTDRRLILAELEKVRADGYCVAEQELVLDMTGVAVPILDRARRPLAAVILFLPMSVWSRTRIEDQLVPMLLDAARAATDGLPVGGRQP